MGKTDDAEAISTLPLTLAAHDLSGRVAKMTIGAARCAGRVEFVN